jgi:hypothetical protein
LPLPWLFALHIRQQAEADVRYSICEHVCALADSQAVARRQRITGVQPYRSYEHTTDSIFDIDFTALDEPKKNHPAARTPEHLA